MAARRSPALARIAGVPPALPFTYRSLVTVKIAFASSPKALAVEFLCAFALSL